MSQIWSDHFQVTTCYWTTHLILLSDSYMKFWGIHHDVADWDVWKSSSNGENAVRIGSHLIN